MEIMAIIKNTGIKRGDKLTSTALNAEFAAVNTGFPMNEDNVRNEGLDYTAFDTGGSGTSTGGNGLILVDANSYPIQASSSSTIVRENPTDGTATVLGTKSGLSISVAAGDIIRVYWQAQIATSHTGTLPIGTSSNMSTACWAMWLTWTLDGAAAVVPGQSNMADPLDTGQVGAAMEKTIATTLIPAHLFHNQSGGSGARSEEFGDRCCYGSYYYKFTSSGTISAFSLSARGLFMPLYKPTGGSIPATIEDRNCLLLQTLTAGNTAQVTFTGIDLGYLLMRSE
jgi:hypothetical protein